MVVTRTVKTFFDSLGEQEKRKFLKTIIPRNKFVRLQDHIMLNVIFDKHDDEILSHHVEKYVFYVVLYEGEVCYLYVEPKDNFPKGKVEAISAYEILKKYGSSPQSVKKAFGEHCQRRRSA